MRLYSDKLTRQDLFAALPDAGDVYLQVVDIKRPRLTERGWTFRLEALRSTGRLRNSGTHGAENTRAATWDEHGAWMARLFAIDPAARIGPYNGADDFERQTHGAYAEHAQ